MARGADAEQRFRAVFEEHYSLILVTCRRRLSDAEAAEDAAAEVFRIAWQKMSAGKTAVDLPWLYRTARNVVGNEYRRRTRSQALVEKAGLAASIVGHDAPDGEQQEVRDALSRIKKADRELLFMAYWEELSVAEMASILRVREQTLRMRLTRARQAVRDGLVLDRGEERKAVIADG